VIQKYSFSINVTAALNAATYYQIVNRLPARKELQACLYTLLTVKGLILKISTPRMA